MANGDLTTDQQRRNALLIQLKTLGYPHNPKALERVASDAKLPPATLQSW